MYFIQFLFWYLTKQALFYIKKFQNNLRIFVDLFVGSSRFVLFFSLRIVFLCCMFNLQTFTIKCKSNMQYMSSFIKNK